MARMPRKAIRENIEFNRERERIRRLMGCYQVWIDVQIANQNLILKREKEAIQRESEDMDRLWAPIPRGAVKLMTERKA